MTHYDFSYDGFELKFDKNKTINIMKTQVSLNQKRAFYSFSFLMAMLLASSVLNPVYSQTSKAASSQVEQEGKTIKGVITNSEGPLESASIILKGSKVGTSSDAKGEFTFPKPLKNGDVLLITYLGYEPQSVTIKEDNTFLRLQLTEDLVEFMGALNTDTPYKSKRSKE